MNEKLQEGQEFSLYDFQKMIDNQREELCQSITELSKKGGYIHIKGIVPVRVSQDDGKVQCAYEGKTPLSLDDFLSSI